MENSAEVLKRIRDLAKARASKYYQSKKNEINEKRRKIYKDNVGNNKEPEIELPPPVVTRKRGRPPAVQPQVEERVVTKQDVLNKFEELNYKKDTLKTYTNNLNQLMRVTDCDNLALCLQNHKDIIKRVNQAKTVATAKKSSVPYGTSTLLGIFQIILVIIDQMKLNIDKQPYHNEFEIKKIMSADEKAQRQENENVDAVYTFKAYLQKVKSAFGENSKEYLLSSMYNELTIRDDYAVKIISNADDANDNKTINYIVVSDKTPVHVIINAYKTSKKYGVIKYTYSKALSNRIRAYIDDNLLEEGEYLFGDKVLSSFISGMNKKIDKDIKGGVNNMRHMKVSDEIKTIKTPAERLALANKMNHSPVTQLWYVRKHKITL